MKQLEESHIFMCCTKLREQAFTPIPAGYHLRCCRPEELLIWKDFPFDTPEQAEEHRPFMDAYFSQTYGEQQAFFYVMNRIGRFVPDFCGSTMANIPLCIG